MSTKRPTRGVIYMAWGEAATREAEDSMASLWEHTRLPVIVVGDQATAQAFAGRENVRAIGIETDPYDATRKERVQFLAGRVKPLLYGLSPWGQTLYVDADTAFRRDPAVGFDLLERWDLVLAETETRTLADSIAGAEETLWTSDWLGTPHALYHNSGMLFWRRCGAIERLFELWSEEWRRFEGWDEQVALLRALLRSDALYLTVPYTWNHRTTGKSYLVHHRFGVGAARQNTPQIAGEGASTDPAAQALAEGDPNRIVRVLVGHRRYVQCRAFEAEEYRQRYRSGGF